MRGMCYEMDQGEKSQVTQQTSTDNKCLNCEDPADTDSRYCEFCQFLIAEAMEQAIREPEEYQDPLEARADEIYCGDPRDEGGF